MSRILHTYTERTVEALDLEFVLDLLEDAALDKGISLPDVRHPIPNPKTLCKLLARVGVSARLRGDVISVRPDPENAPFHFIEVKVPTECTDERCVRCGGEGRLPQFTHVDNGTCYRCGGTGRDPSPQYAAWKNAELREHSLFPVQSESTLDRLAHAWADQPVLL